MRPGRALACAMALTLAAGCATTPLPREHAGPALPASSKRLFTAALEQINERYVRPVQVGALVELGVAQVLRGDPSLRVQRDGDRLEIRNREALLVQIGVRPDGGVAGWAGAAITAIDAARARVPVLRELEPGQTHRLFFEGVAKGLDSYSRYNTPESAREERAQREGFGGVGIVIDTDAGEVRVVTVMEGSPAARAGLLPEDRILTIANESTQGMAARDVVRRLRGPIGTEIRVRIRREGAAAPVEVGLLRAHIVPQTVAYRREGDVAYVKLSGFNPKTTETLVEAVRRAEREIGPRMAGMVLDLRNNFGGYLDQSIYIADLFLAEGAIVSMRGRHRTVAQESWARRGDIGERIPMVVLINGNSASASEIVAAALQDHNRAVVIGSASFGKGSVQSILPLPDEGELVLTSARFHAPSGYALADLGVLPTICTSGGRSDAAALVEQLRTGRFADQGPANRWRRVAAEDVDGRRKLRQSSCPSETAERDADLDLALRLLGDRSLHALALASGATLATALPR